MMHSTLMKRVLLVLSILMTVSIACDLSVAVAPTASPVSRSTNTVIPTTIAPTQIPATVAPEATPTVPVPAFEGVQVAVDPLSVILSPALASGARGLQFPRAEGDTVAPWKITPGHIQLKLEGYVLQDRFHEPQIYVYPASGYAEMVPAAFESMHRLNNILYDPNAPIAKDQLPLVPFFNAGQVFASHIQIISFQNGRGVRFLTEYAQNFATINNHDMFYHFQGLTNDGVYYIIAIFPISAPILAETSDPTAIVPAGGAAFPDIADPNADFLGYYTNVTALLNATPPEAFTPTIYQLDLLIQSMQVAP